MPAAKTAAKKPARTAKAVVAKKLEKEPEEIRVKAIEKGFYANLIRNPGEVFLMDVEFFEKAPTEEEYKALKKEQKDLVDDHDRVVVNSVEYLLPTWVELADEDETDAKGHVSETPE